MPGFKNPCMKLVAECQNHQGPLCPLCAGKGWNYIFNREDGLVREGRDLWERKQLPVPAAQAVADSTPPAQLVEVLEDPTGTYVAIVEVRDVPTPTARGVVEKGGTTSPSTDNSW